MHFSRETRRRVAAALCAAAIFAAEIATLDRTDARARVSMAMRRHDLVRDRIEGTDFLFDRPYGEFLEGLDRTATPGVPVALCLPHTNELYDYAAAYVLSPRPVRRAEGRDANFAWRCPGAGVPAR